MSVVSFVFPVFNEEDNLEPLYREVTSMCRQAMVDYELIFVDDGSTDRSLEIIRSLREQDMRVDYIVLSRNFGHQEAIVAGMSYATGNAIVTMDADLQHPPSLLPQMIGLWREGVEVVYTTKRDAQISFIRGLWVRSFYWLMSKLSGLKLEFGQCDFRLLDRRVAQTVLQLKDYHTFLRGQVEWVGFRQQGLAYDVAPRRGGAPKLDYRSRFSFACDGIFGFSTYPLHIVLIAGALIAVSSLTYMLVVCGMWFMHVLGLPGAFLLPSGWATLTVSILFLGSLQLVGLGIIGAYVGRVYDQTKQRPVFIVRESSMASRASVVPDA